MPDLTYEQIVDQARAALNVPEGESLFEAIADLKRELAELTKIRNRYAAPDAFGQVVWRQADIESALQDANKPVTDSNIELVMDSLGHIEDRMIERGWEVIHYVVDEEALTQEQIDEDKEESE
jgi:hypothetical protein